MSFSVFKLSKMNGYRNTVKHNIMTSHGHKMDFYYKKHDRMQGFTGPTTGLQGDYRICSNFSSPQKFVIGHTGCDSVLIDDEL